MGSHDDEMRQLLARARKRIETLESQVSMREPVAVIGLACRLPAAQDAAQFWKNLVEGVDGVGPLRDGRWDTQRLVSHGPNPEPGKMRTADGGFLEDIRAFDAAFFGISGREAEYMDPQQRLLLETSWHALEDAGILPARLAGTDTGVFVGISSADYAFRQAGSTSAREAWAGTGNALSIAANRLSYVLNLNGPSLAVDTACSSSLVAIHQAMRSLRLGECSTAVVAGVNVILNPDTSIAFSQAGMLSPTGRCRTFDASADGYVRSEGVGVVILKRLNEAQRDGDHIRAVIAGSAVNQDGRGNGLTAPNGLAQQAVIKAAMRDAGITAKDIAYIEAHGTGTPLGDPIEINNLAKVMEVRQGDPVLVGAVKAAIGHTEAAAGMAGLIKTVLALEAGEIPGQPHLKDLNPRLKDAAERIVTPVRDLTPWPKERDFAGISAFGFGGTNAHVVLKRHMPAPVAQDVETPEGATLVLSARSELALRTLAQRLSAMPVADPCDLASSIATRRTTHAYRLALPVRRDAPEAVGLELGAWIAGSPSRIRAGHRLGSRPPRLVFAFSGQGSQHLLMGRNLYNSSPVFRATLDQVNQAFEQGFGVDLLSIVFGADENLLRQTEYAQPAIFALQVALVAEMRHRGVTPDAVMGYSLGEYTAACIADALPVNEMTNLVGRRGALFQSLPDGGAMLSVRAPAEWLSRALAGQEAHLAVAARLSPETQVIAGDGGAIERLRGHAVENGFSARLLPVSHAFHSPLLDPILPSLGTLCMQAGFAPLTLPLVSNLDGSIREPGAVLDADHWVRHSREPVEFFQAIETLAKDPRTVVLEIGANNTLTALGRASGLLEAERFVATLSGRGDEAAELDDALANLAALGVDLADAGRRGGTFPGSALPLYPFERTSYWLEPAPDVRTTEANGPAFAEMTPPSLDETSFSMDGGRIRLFADQLELVRKTIFSQLDFIETVGRGEERQSHGKAEPEQLPASIIETADAGASTLPDGEGPRAAMDPSEQPETAARMRPAAELVWLLAQKSDDASRAYQIPVLLELTGSINPQHIRRALDVLLERHEALRAVFPNLGEMHICPAGAVMPDFEFIDARDWSPEDKTGWISALGEEAFDLERGRLFRSRLARMGETSWLLALEAHHLVMDGLSMNFLVGELAALYNGFERGVEVDLPEAISYRQWLARHLAARSTPQAVLDRSYWLERLGHGAPALDLPTDRPRASAKGWRGHAVLELMQPAEAESVRRAARALGLTPFMLLHSLLALVLGRYAGQTKVAIATPTAGRPADMTAPLIGYCSDLIFSLSTIDPAQSLEDYCRRVRTDLLSDMSHSGYSFAWIAEDMRATGAELPLQVVFNYQNAYVSASFEGATAEILPRALRYLDGELTLNAVDVGGGLALELNFNSGLFEESTARALLDAYSNLLRAVASGARGSIGSLPLVSGAGSEALAVLGRGETSQQPEQPAFRTFEQVAKANPDRIAILDGTTSLTYGTLDARANGLAHRLLENGLEPEELVAIHLPRSIDLIVAQLAIAKAGGAFLVLDRRQPADWRGKILSQAGIRLVIGNQEDLTSDTAMFLDADAKPHSAAPYVDIALDRLMYVIFTSGSTGEPKGVMIEHGSVANYVAWLGRELDIGTSDRFLQFSAISFDASIEEIYTALTHGASLTLRAEELPTPAAFWDNLAAKGVTILDLPTAYWHELMLDEQALRRIPGGLRHVILGGEAAKPMAVERWRAQAPGRIGLWNTYGPTETTIVCTAARLDGQQSLQSPTIPIGTPVANAVALVLDGHLQPLPPGAIGELYIGGAGLARGYLNRPDLTSASFIALPGKEGRFYRTGDLVRWRPDGLLEYHGRVDNQVKIRGFRIETGEIEKALERLEGVSAAAVFAHDVEGLNRLAAYIVPAENACPEQGMIQAALRRTLPNYLVPQAIVTVSRLPLNANGKVDRRALPAIDWATALAGSPEADAAPLDANEALVADIWAEVLGIKAQSLAPDSDFFMVGGDSLLAMRVLTRLNAVTQTTLSPRELFGITRLGDLARLVAGASSRDGEVAQRLPARLPREGALPMSSSQRRLWFLHQLDPASGAYNLPSRIELEGALDEARLRAALGALAIRHESLRCRFVDNEGQPVAVIDAEASIPFEIIDLSAEPDSETAVNAAATATSGAPFKLDGGPLARATLFRCSPSRHVLLLCAHHIITDGWSMAILGRDFAEAYAAGPEAGPLCGLAPLELGYVDYAAAAGEARAALDIEPLRNFWRDRLGDLPEALEMPTDRPRPDRPDGRGKVHRFALPLDLTQHLRDVARLIGVTPFAVLFSTWGLLLAKRSGQPAFAIGTVSANRVMPGAEDIVGFFAETLGLRFEVGDRPSFADLCRRTQRELADAMAHCALPLEMIVEDLVSDRSEAHSPIFQTMFVWQNTPSVVQQVGELVMHAERLDKGATQFDLVLDMTETAEGIEAMLEYRTQLFESASIDRLADAFVRLLGWLVEQPDAAVSDPGPLEGRSSLISRAVCEIADRRVDAVLDDWAKARPEATAVIFEAEDASIESLTWAEFQASAHAMAAVMQAGGIGAGDTVAICAERSLELLVAIYATMVAGAAYAPLDPSAPAERQRMLLSASHARLLVTQSGLLDLFSVDGEKLDVAYLLLDAPLVSTTHSLERVTDAAAPVYVIFTSGTTGTPKGVLVPHRGVANMALGMGRLLGVEPSDSLLQFAPLNFDASALQIFLPLLSGGCSVLHHGPDRLGASDLMDLASRHGLTMLDLPAALWRQWVDTMMEEGMRMAPSIRIFLTGGEALSTRTLRRWSALCDRKVVFLSSYGPTEASITATAYVSDSEALATIEDGGPDIGRPLPNVAVHVLDLFGAPAATGVIGEIAIGGPGVAIGYLDSPQRTAEVFVERPGLGRLYLTGDYGRLTETGAFEFHGRRDAQIKIRGFRIEPAEVEAAILTHPAIAQALVTTQKTADRRTHLVAYVVTSASAPTPEDAVAEKALIDSLRAHLKGLLPDTMTPSAFMRLDAFPLLPSGKTNRRALPAIGISEAQAGPYEPPLPGVETALAEVWRDMLKLATVGRHDNFFELGGDSILCLQMTARARRAGVEFEVRDVFRHQTVAELAAIARLGGPMLVDQGPISGRAPLPNTSAMLFARSGLRAEKLEVRVPPGLSTERLGAVFEALVLHHDGLRAAFSLEPAPTLVIGKTLAPDLWQETRPAGLAAAIARAESEVLEAEPHFRAIFQNDASGRLFFIAHPALVDPWSWCVIAEDFVRLATEGGPLARKSASVLALSALDDGSVADSRSTPSRQRMVFDIGPKTAAALDGPALAAWRTSAGEIALAALARSLARRQANGGMKLDVLWTGRPERGPADLSRTVWHLARPGNLRIEQSARSAVRDWLIAVKDASRLALDFSHESTASVLFVDRPCPELPQGWSVDAASARQESGHALVVSLDLATASLVLDHDESVWPESRVADLAASLLSDLDEMVAACLMPGAGGLTPSDVPLATVDQAELDRLLAETPEIETLYDASFGQTGMIFHSLLAPASGAFVIQTRVDFSAALDVDALRSAVGDLMMRHPVLRTGFRWQDRSQPLQVVYRCAGIPFETVDISDSHDEAAAILAIAESDLARPLDLFAPPLMRLTLLRRRSGWTLIWLKHHAVIDGWSMPLLYDDLMGYYGARAAGRELEMLPAPGFDRYIDWLTGWDSAAARRHWSEELSGFDTPTALAIGRGATAETGAVGRAGQQLAPADFARLMETARTERVTLGTLVIGAFIILLSRYCGSKEVLTHVTVSGRPPELTDAENIVGMFLNTLPLRAEVEDGEAIWPWLRGLQERHAVNDAMGHLGLVDIQRFSDVPAGQRLSETLIIVQNTPLGAAMSAGLGAGAAGLSGLVTAVEGLQKTGAPVTLFAEGRDSDLTFTVQYDAGRFDHAEMAELAARLARILREMASGVKLGDLRLLDPDEEAAIIARSCGPSMPLPEAPSLIVLFEQQVDRTPDRIALFDSEQRLTYRKLDEHARRIALALIEQGVVPGDVVGILSERSLNATAAILGIMKAGAAFLAVDPSYPLARQHFMLEDSGAQILLHAGQLDPTITTRSIALEEALAHAATSRLTPPGSSVLVPESLAYLIYTSGSTGQPKGVRALHRGALNRFGWMWREMPFADGEVMVQKTALSFVDSIWEIFGPLLAGIPSLVLDDVSARDVPRFMQLVAQHKVSRLVLVPTLLRAMLEIAPDLGSRLPELAHWISSGEALPADLVAAFRRAAPGRRLINLYGSSEVAGDVTWYDTDEMAVDALLPASLGRPLDNTGVYLLDAGRRPVPDGMPGELWIGGANLADGYHGLPQLSADAFVANPFGEGLLFRSRDWGRREKDGTITFLGRQDGQVKIRGMRVDLAEVEAIMRGIDGVETAVALNRPGADGRPRIVGWFVGDLSTEAFRTALEERLPRYMVPAALVALEAIPLLPNGKVDRRALPEPRETGPNAGETIVLPQTRAEILLAQIWADVLGLEPSAISRTHNYFSLGGDSISAIRVATRAAAAGLALSVRDVFETATLSDLAARLQSGEIALAEPVALGTNFPNMAPDHWRSFAVSLDAAVTEANVEQALEALLRAHDLLTARIVFEPEGALLIPASGISAERQGEGLAVFEAGLETSATGLQLRLAGHPLLLDATAWTVIISDLLSLLAGTALTKPTISFAKAPPIIGPDPRAVLVAGSTWAIDADDSLFASAGQNLRTSPDELIAAAMIRAFASAGMAGALSIIIAERMPKHRRIVTSRERIVSLPRSTGHAAADLRAAKKAMRKRAVNPGAANAGLTVRLPGAAPAFEGVSAVGPVLMLGFGANVHLDVVPLAAGFSIVLYQDDRPVSPAIEKMIEAFVEALGEYRQIVSLGRNSSVWLSSDFPLAAIKPAAVAMLAARYPDVETVQAVTPGQMGMVFHSLADPDSAVYGLHTTIRLAPGVDLKVLEAAFAALIDRHSILRTSFDWTLHERPLQIVHRRASVPIEVLDWRRLSPDEYRENLSRRIAADRATPIDLTRAPAMRATVVLRDEGPADLLWAVHHAAVDGWSLPILLRDLAGLYDRLMGLPTAMLPEAPDFAAYLGWIAGRDRALAVAHWRSQVNDISSGTDLVIGRGAASETGDFESLSVHLDASRLQPLLRKARAEGITPSTLVQGAWAAVLARYNQADEQVFGVTVSGRPAELEGIEEAVGPFVNVLPLRLPTRDDVPLWDWLRTVQKAHAANDQHNYLSFADIQALSALPAGERLCDSMLVVQNFPMDQRLLSASTQVDAGSGGKVAGLMQHIEDIRGHQTTSYAVTVFALPQNDSLDIEFVYDAGRFDRSSMEALSAHISRVFESMSTAESLRDIDITDAQEERALLALGQGPEAITPEASSVLALFERLVDTNPQAPALFHDGHITTYADMEAGANRIAADIIGHGLRKGAIIAVHMQRSPGMVMALLAIMKAGAAWLPLDPAYPADRLSYMLDDSGAALVIRDRLPLAFECSAPTLNAHDVLASGTTAPRPAAVATPDDLAYLIYTSGSTGRPKGVRALHRGLLNRLEWSWRALPYGPDEVAVIKTALPFVDSVAEIFGPLAKGVPAVVVSTEDATDIGRFIEILEEGRVTWIVLVPSLLRAIIDMPERVIRRLRGLRTWIVSGEALTAELVGAFRQTFPGARLVNFYGSSEVAGDVTCYDTSKMAADDPTAQVPIGSPIDGNRAHILDRRLRPMPKMMPGELYVSGENLADGYHANEALTAEAFLPNPFGPGRMFRTKDWARWNHDGLIEYLGRQDSQVKIRGMRVEIGEVEAVLRSQSGVEDAVVRPYKAADGNIALVAYWSGQARAEELRQGLGNMLAGYMTPQHWIKLAALPLLPNGKIDRKSLPDPEAALRDGATKGEVEAPLGHLEHLLLPVWSAALGLPETEISVAEDFFALGGHSLAAARLMAEATRRTGVSLRLRSFYEASSLRDVATHVEAELLSALVEGELEALIVEARREANKESMA